MAEVELCAPEVNWVSEIIDTMKNFQIVIDYKDGNYSVSSPAVPGFQGAGLTPEEGLYNFRTALQQFVEDEQDIRHGTEMLARIKDHPEELLDAEDVFRELGL